MGEIHQFWKAYGFQTFQKSKFRLPQDPSAGETPFHIDCMSVTPSRTLRMRQKDGSGAHFTVLIIWMWVKMEDLGDHKC